jgi:hypothetical protein
VENFNFYCEPSQILSLSCSETFTIKIFMYFVGIIYGLLPLSGILFSYYKIISSILRISSSGGKHKALFTCWSHLSVVGLFYGTCLRVYVGSVASHSHKTVQWPQWCAQRSFLCWIPSSIVWGTRTLKLPLVDSTAESSDISPLGVYLANILGKLIKFEICIVVLTCFFTLCLYC